MVEKRRGRGGAAAGAGGGGEGRGGRRVVEGGGCGDGCGRGATAGELRWAVGAGPRGDGGDDESNGSVTKLEMKLMSGCLQDNVSSKSAGNCNNPAQSQSESQSNVDVDSKNSTDYKKNNQVDSDLTNDCGAAAESLRRLQNAKHRAANRDNGRNHLDAKADSVNAHDAMRQIVRDPRDTMRQMVHRNDVDKIKELTTDEVADVNMTLTDVLCNTALICAVKCGYLEVVEAFLALPQCRLDVLNRRRHSALDESFRSCLRQPARDDNFMTPLPTDDTQRRHRLRRHQRARTFRILQRLLDAGASTISVHSLDLLIRRALGGSSDGRPDVSGLWFVSKLVRTVCGHGRARVKSAVLGILVYHEGVEKLLTALIHSNARLPPSWTLDTLMLGRSSATPGRNVQGMCVNNILLLLRAYSDRKVLDGLIREVVEALDHAEQEISTSWSDYYCALRILTVAGCPLPIRLFNHLYRHHPDAYSWIRCYGVQPRSLCEASRNVIRKCMRDSNAFVGCRTLRDYPESLKLYIMYTDV